MPATRVKRSETPRPTGIFALATAMSHPIRVRIIGAMNSPPRVYSPSGLAEEMGVSLGVVSYHVRELHALGFIKVVRTEPRRGAVEHYYEPTKRAAAWDREWEQLPPAAKQNLAAFALRLGVESIGASIDAGVYESRDDSVLAQDTLRVDERGATEAMTILLHALDALVKVSEQAEARLAENEEEGSLVSYLLAGFPGAIRPV